MTSDSQVPEAFLELILLRQVVIRTQHAQEDTFPETVQTDEKQAIRLILQQGQVHRLVYIIQIPLHHVHEVGNSIRYSFCLFHRIALL